MDLHYTPVTGHLRVYAEGKNYEDYDEYESIFTIQFLERGSAFISGFRGEMNKRAYLAIFKWLRANDISRVSWERRGKLITKETSNK